MNPVVNDQSDSLMVKVVGGRKPGRRDLISAAPFLELVIRLRGNKPFIPKGVYRFSGFNENQKWSIIISSSVTILLVALQALK